MMLKQSLALSLLAVLAACSKQALETTDAPAATATAKFELSADPGAATSVVKAKADGAKDHVVVEGRIYDITKGFAVLKLMDMELDYCGEVNKEDTCPTPWDYCCDQKEVRLAHSLLVEARGEDGTPLMTPTLPGLRLCDQVKVAGKLVVDEHGNHLLVASGWYRVERPTLPDYVKWPQ